MAKSEWDQSKDRFLYPKYPYHGTFTPQTLIFNANLQEFSQKVEYIAALHSNGKLSSEQAYQELQRIWSQLRASHQLITPDNNDD